MFQYIFFWIWIFFLQFQILKALRWDGNTMYDLEYQTSAFDAEAAPWFQSAYLGGGIKASSCDGSKIMGGFSVMGGSNPKGYYWERLYTGIPTPHNVIYASIKIYPLDSWDNNQDDHFELYFDGTIIVGWHFDYTSPYAVSYCGNPAYPDIRPIRMYATVPHTAEFLTFRVINSLNDPSADESVGFRDIKMEFKQIANPPSTYSFCGITEGYPLDSNPCPCNDGTYMYPPNSGLCVNPFLWQSDDSNI